MSDDVWVCIHDTNIERIHVFSYGIYCTLRHAVESKPYMTVYIGTQSQVNEIAREINGFHTLSTTWSL